MRPFTALIPLETLPSWPAVQDPTLLEILTLTVFIPVGATVVLAVLTLGRGWRTQQD